MISGPSRFKDFIHFGHDGDMGNWLPLCLPLFLQSRFGFSRIYFGDLACFGRDPVKSILKIVDVSSQLLTPCDFGVVFGNVHLEESGGRSLEEFEEGSELVGLVGGDAAGEVVIHGQEEFGFTEHTQLDGLFEESLLPLVEGHLLVSVARDGLDGDLGLPHSILLIMDGCLLLMYKLLDLFYHVYFPSSPRHVSHTD